MTPEHKEQCTIVKEKLQECAEDLKSHILDEENKISEVTREVKFIRENHIAHIQIDLTETKTNVEWLLRYHWIVATASIGALVVGVLNFLG